MSRLLCNGLFVVGLLLLWWGCNPVPKAGPNITTCRGILDCPPDMNCQMGSCVTKTPQDGGGGEGGTSREAISTGDGPCVNGATRACATIPVKQRNQGTCKDGTQLCQGNVWGECKDEVKPAAEEVCDGKDDDCDGEVDEGCQCQPGDSRPCGEGLGECKQGEQICRKNGSWGLCAGNVEPTKEVCDEKDNDCDGKVDEDFQIGESCTEGVGACAGTGTYKCEKGKRKCDATPGAKKTEICNGIDDDCNGTVDDGLTKTGKDCTVPGQQGPCAKGTFACEKGVEICKPLLIPNGQQETCNDKDDDCDGFVDEAYPDKGNRCTVGLGACLQVGVLICNPKGDGLVCDKTPLAPGASDDKICDGKDEDCDGSIDEDCPCNSHETRICYSGSTGCTKISNGWNCKAPCKVGSQKCLNGAFGACAGEVLPKTETCDGKDEDCDGVIDNGNPGAGLPCEDSSAKGECKKGKTACQSGSTVCLPLHTATQEVCDGKDNDCDGQTDEGNPSANLPCSTGKPGVCAKGVTSCVNGVVACTPKIAATAELCDGEDNDCDGQTDEDNPEGGKACEATGAKGICKEGKEVCVGGKLVCTPGAKQSEVCNNKDDDCDGQPDEGLSCKKDSRKCGGVAGQEKLKCKSDCSGFTGDGYCNPIAWPSRNRKACFEGRCVSCTACSFNSRSCQGSDKNAIFRCRVDAAKGVCGWVVDQKCSGGRRCRNGLLGPYCG